MSLTSRAMGNLIKTNLKVYFDLIKRGLDHEDALAMVLKSRYPFERGKIRKVMTELPRIVTLNAVREIAEPTHEELLRALVCTMYLVETKIDFADEYTVFELNMELVAMFNDLYDSTKAKHL